MRSGLDVDETYQLCIIWLPLGPIFCSISVSNQGLHRSFLLIILLSSRVGWVNERDLERCDSLVIFLLLF